MHTIVMELRTFKNCTRKYIKNNYFPIDNEGEQNLKF